MLRVGQTYVCDAQICTITLMFSFYLGFGPQFASGFSWYRSNFFCLDAGLAPGFNLNDTCIAGSLLRIVAPGEFSFFRFTGCSFSQHLMMSHTTALKKKKIVSEIAHFHCILREKYTAVQKTTTTQNSLRCIPITLP